MLPALHAHLPCATLLNSEECALSEKKKRRKEEEEESDEFENTEDDHEGVVADYDGEDDLDEDNVDYIYSVMSDDDDEQLSHD